MGTISVSLPSDGETIDAADYNTPINTIVNEINGGLDNANIASGAAISGAKLADNSVTNAKIDFGGSGAGVWWEEIGRTTNSGQASISVASLPARKYLQVIAEINISTSMDLTLRFNNDSGNNYTWYSSLNAAAPTTAQSTSSIRLATGTSSTNRLIVLNIVNFATRAKSVNGQASAATNAATTQGSWELAATWVNTSDSINRIDIIGSTGNLGSAEIVVLGHD